MSTIIFDWDGTLIDSLPAVTRANRLVLARYGIELDDDTYRRLYRADWRQMYLDLGVSRSDIGEAGDGWIAAYGMGDGAALFPGVRSAVARLADAGVALGIVTAGDREVVGHQLEIHGLDRFFPVRVYGGDLPAGKPDPGPLRLALDRLSHPGSLETAIYVGDAPDDMRMARAAGTRAVGIHSFLGLPDALTAAGAETVYENVPGFVDAWFAGSDGRQRRRARLPGAPG
jgi:HAD superfamily hydrolase (TIGR01549 family)